jgi:hypothetical protein
MAELVQRHHHHHHTIIIIIIIPTFVRNLVFSGRQAVLV